MVFGLYFLLPFSRLSTIQLYVLELSCHPILNIVFPFFFIWYLMCIKVLLIEIYVTTYSGNAFYKKKIKLKFKLKIFYKNIKIVSSIILWLSIVNLDFMEISRLIWLSAYLLCCSWAIISIIIVSYIHKHM